MGVAGSGAKVLSGVKYNKEGITLLPSGFRRGGQVVREEAYSKRRDEGLGVGARR